MVMNTANVDRTRLQRLSQLLFRSHVTQFLGHVFLFIYLHNYMSRSMNICVQLKFVNF